MRVVLDVGCGVASFGGSLLDRNVITMSFAPKDEHEAQIQFALERGIPATLSVIGTQKLAFPDNAFDLIHCARCRVHWDASGEFSIFLFLLFPYKSFTGSFKNFGKSVSKFHRWQALVGAQQDSQARWVLHLVCYTSI